MNPLPPAAATPLPAADRRGVDAALSAKLRALAPIGILMVVVGHSPSFRDPAAPSERSVGYATVEFLFADALPRIVVMMFFAVSGFLLFTGHDGSGATHARKIGSRLRSLLVPYVVWSALSMGVYALLQALPWTSGWFTNPARRIVGRPLPDLLLVFAFDPIAYQLWFLRDLLILALLSPLLHPLLSRAGAFTVAALGVAHAFNLQVPSPVAGVPLLTGDGYFYFALGGWFALRRLPLAAPGRWAIPAALLVLAVAVLRAWGHASGRFDHPEMAKAVHLAGVPALWIGYDRWLRWLERPALQGVADLAFFVFVAHEPLMTMLRKPVVRILGAGDVAHALELLATLGGTILLVLALGAWLRSRLPRLYAFLCGGRGAPRQPASNLIGGSARARGT